MDKNALFIRQILLCILCFIYSWFRFTLYDRLFIFVIPIPNILFVFIIILIVKSFSILRDEKKIWWFLYIILVIITIFLFKYDFRLIKTKLELGLFEKERNVIIEKVKNNEFAYGYNNYIVLPIYNYVSSSGNIIVYKNDDSGVVISFFVSEDAVELVYSSKGEDLIRESKKPWKSIENIIKLKEDWYYVEYAENE